MSQHQIEAIYREIYAANGMTLNDGEAVRNVVAKYWGLLPRSLSYSGQCDRSYGLGFLAALAAVNKDPDTLEAARKNAERMIATGRALPVTPAGVGCLDLAWEKINALGGSKPSTYDDYGRGIIYAVERALEIIEELGGSDPLPKRAALVADKET